MLDSCCLCKAVDDSLQQGDGSRIENRLLFKSKHFIVIPSIGPIVNGQFMIVSKNHYSNLAHMDIEHIADLQNLISHLHGIDKEINNNVLIVEHGGNSQIDKGGACVIHTHLHWMPTYGDKISNLKNLLPLFNSIDSLDRLIGLKSSYLLTIDNSKIIKVYNSTGAPSQYIRRLLLAQEGITEWNWRLNPNYNLIQSTVKYFKG